MEPTRTAYGIWSGGRFMHFGEAIDEERMEKLIRRAYDRGVRTFMTADVYGKGAADEMMGKALSGLPRDTYCLIGILGHDFYSAERKGIKGFPRFTHPELRQPSEYKSYLRMATEKSLERCQADKFDLLMLHNPDSIGYSNDTVWSGMADLKAEGLADRLGVAPGPANGFTLDILLNFERFEELIDWAMIILNPLEPWPGDMLLPGAEKHGVDLITRVVDYGGLFHGDVKPGHEFGEGDHRTFRPEGWVEAGNEKIDRMRDVAEKHGLSMLQLACAWNLSQTRVKSVVPTLIQEVGGNAKPIEEKLDDLAGVSDLTLSDEEVATIREIGNNKGCMTLKGGNPEYEGDPVADRWELSPDLASVGETWGIKPEVDLACVH